METDISGGEGEAKAPAAYHQQRHRYADTLGADGGNGGSQSTQAQDGHQKIISRHIDGAGDGHGHQGGLGIPHAPEDAAEDIVGGDEAKPRPAHTDVGERGRNGLLRHLGDAGQPSGAQNGKGGEKGGDEGEEGDAAADDGAGLLPLTLAQRLAQHDGGAHGETGDHAGDGVHQLAACGYRRHIGGGGEAAHHPKVHRTIGRL